MNVNKEVKNLVKKIKEIANNISTGDPLADYLLSNEIKFKAVEELYK